MSNWESIWNSRQGSSCTLGDLIMLNGFDVGAGKTSEEDWMAFVRNVASVARYRAGETLIELGCGSGAFLYALQQTKPGMSMTGVDYSTALLEIASARLPGVEFIASDLRRLTADLPAQNHVLIHSVLQYLEIEEVGQLIESCFELATKTIAILGVPDKALEDESEDYRVNARPQNYAQVYRHLSHTYIEREFFEALKSTSWNLEWLPIELNNDNAPYRFSLIFRRS